MHINDGDMLESERVGRAPGEWQRAARPLPGVRGKATVAGRLAEGVAGGGTGRILRHDRGERMRSERSGQIGHGGQPRAEHTLQIAVAGSPWFPRRASGHRAAA